MAIIDADAHVVESERTWDFIDEAERQFAPRVMVFKDHGGDGSGKSGTDEFWKIGGVIEGHVPFWAVSLPHQNAYHSSRFTTVRSARFGCDNLHHLTLTFGDGELREALLKAANTETETIPAAAGGSAFARLVNFKLVWCENQTITIEENEFLGKTTRTVSDTLRGDVGDFEYGLIQRGDDCEVHLRQKRDGTGSTYSMAEVTAALLQALAFLHGRHAWPQWQRIVVS